MMHILLKHQGSARQSSWRDPDGKHIRQRTREAAAGMLRELLQDVYTRNGGLDRAERFAQLAGEVSDCGSARDGGGGDLGELEAGAMDEAFEEAVFGLPVWALTCKGMAWPVPLHRTSPVLRMESRRITRLKRTRSASAHTQAHQGF